MIINILTVAFGAINELILNYGACLICLCEQRSAEAFAVEDWCLTKSVAEQNLILFGRADLEFDMRNSNLTLYSKESL